MRVKFAFSMMTSIKNEKQFITCYKYRFIFELFAYVYRRERIKKLYNTVYTERTLKCGVITSIVVTIQLVCDKLMFLFQFVFYKNSIQK
jgi:hypothetical protein